MFSSSIQNIWEISFERFLNTNWRYCKTEDQLVHFTNCTKSLFSSFGTLKTNSNFSYSPAIPCLHMLIRLTLKFSKHTLYKVTLLISCMWGDATLHCCDDDDAASLSVLSQGNLCVRCLVKTNYLANAHFGPRGRKILFWYVLAE